MSKLNFCLHTGGEEVSWDAVTAVKTPEATKTWQPIGHDALVTRVKEALPSFKLQVTQEAHAMSENGDRYFGLFQVEHAQEHKKDFGFVLGLRNSHDQKFSAGLVVGTGVFICDNLAFSGEIKLARKHTTHILRDLPRLANDGISALMGKWNTQVKRYGAYRNHELDDTHAHDLLVRAVEKDAVSRMKMLDVLSEWREPRHKEFQPRTAWSMFNAFTETLKGSSLAVLSQRTELLHGLFDAHLGLATIHGEN